MKKILFPLIFCCFVFQMMAQQNGTADNATARSITEKLTTLYDLDADQVKKMYQIQARKQQQLLQIQPLETADPDVYLKKLRALHEGNEGSVKLLLNTEQLKVYEHNYFQVRKARAIKSTEMKRQGASPAEIEKAIWKID